VVVQSPALAKDIRVVGLAKEFGATPAGDAADHPA
jgi:hypothetical protein